GARTVLWFRPPFRSWPPHCRASRMTVGARITVASRITALAPGRPVPWRGEWNGHDRGDTGPRDPVPRRRRRPQLLPRRGSALPAGAPPEGARLGLRDPLPPAHRPRPRPPGGDPRRRHRLAVDVVAPLHRGAGAGPGLPPLPRGRADARRLLQPVRRRPAGLVE